MKTQPSSAIKLIPAAGDKTDRSVFREERMPAALLFVLLDGIFHIPPDSFEARTVETIRAAVQIKTLFVGKVLCGLQRVRAIAVFQVVAFSRGQRVSLL
jgi:hypothetical protein